MNDEKNTPGSSSENSSASSDNTFTPDNNSGSQDGFKSDDAASNDEYYAVDHAKKDVISTIGDGEMHNEGLLGAEESTIDLQSSMERLTDEQDLAESHDSEQ